MAGERTPSNTNRLDCDLKGHFYPALAGYSDGFHTFVAVEWRPQVHQFCQKCVNFIEFHLNVIYFKYCHRIRWVFCDNFVDAPFVSVIHNYSDGYIRVF